MIKHKYHGLCQDYESLLICDIFDNSTLRLSSGPKPPHLPDQAEGYTLRHLLFSLHYNVSRQYSPVEGTALIVTCLNSDCRD